MMKHHNTLAWVFVSQVSLLFACGESENGPAETDLGNPQPATGGLGDDLSATGGASGGATSTTSGGEASGGTASYATGGETADAAGGETAMDGSGGFTGTCTVSAQVGELAQGTGPHEVVIETNADSGIDEGTIYRPADLDGTEQFPILVWGEGACSQNGLSNRAAMVEIASHGYFVVADGTPNGEGGRDMDRSMLDAMGAPLIAYIDWALSENEKPCSAYYQNIDASKISSNGYSCGGLMAQGTVSDPRIVAWGVTSSGMAGATQAFYELIDTPVLFVEGFEEEVAYDGAKEGYEKISELGVPVLWFSSKSLGHGGDLGAAGGGDFTRINLAWLNWWLKGDETETGKGLLVGASCPYCTDDGWEYLSANVPE